MTTLKGTSKKSVIAMEEAVQNLPNRYITQKEFADIAKVSSKTLIKYKKILFSLNRHNLNYEREYACTPNIINYAKKRSLDTVSNLHKAAIELRLPNEEISFTEFIEKSGVSRGTLSKNKRVNNIARYLYQTGKILSEE